MWIYFRGKGFQKCVFKGHQAKAKILLTNFFLSIEAFLFPMKSTTILYAIKINSYAAISHLAFF